MKADRTIRILHVVGGMNHGGVETWLMHVLRHIDRRRFHMDFLVHGSVEWVHTQEIRCLGSSLHDCGGTDNPLRYASNFLRILADFGPYDVVHSHMYRFSALPILLATAAGVPIRIAHSHTDPRFLPEGMSGIEKSYSRLSRHVLHWAATHRLAASANAAASLFGNGWQSLRNTRVMYCGLDLREYGTAHDRIACRRELGLGQSDFVVTHVGRFVPLKNQMFLLDILAALCNRCTPVKLLLIGEGPTMDSVQSRSRQLALEGKVIFSGARRDVPRLLSGAADVFVFPSLYEGLPLAVMEAQLAGLPVVLSDTITTEADLGIGLLHQMSLGLGPADWADRLLSLRTAGVRVPLARRLEKADRFDLGHAIENLSQCYLGGLC